MRSHLPGGDQACACGIVRAMDTSSENACSAVEIVLPSGVFMTMTPARRGGFHVHVVHADARAADDLERLGGFEHALVDLRFRAHDQRGAIGDDFQELVFLEAGLEDHVERAVALEVFDAARRDGVGDQHFGFVHGNEVGQGS